tara:strand:- start:76 stop:1239 length:1164 start_codon:yes stop_codon:yes gene_type:complete
MQFEKINFITQNFFLNSKVLNIDFIDSGLINKTYIVECLVNDEKFTYILQCLSKIFESQELVNMNHKLITDHIEKKEKTTDLNPHERRWEVPTLIRCNSNNLFLFPFDHHCWRAMVHIDETITFDILEDRAMAYQVGIGLAKFHTKCSDLDLKKLVNSFKNFHNINFYIYQFNNIIRDYNFRELEENIEKRVQNLISNLSNHIKYIKYLLGYLNKKSIKFSIIHGDPKLNNFLFDSKYKYVVSLIDLDTVSSGYLLTDLADCLRSICNVVGEDPCLTEDVYFEIDSCENFLKGYYSIQNRNSDFCFELLPEYIYLIIVELTIRFVNDFLQSNRYFKINYKTQNLHRAEVQYQLLSSFISQTPDLLNLLSEFGISSNRTFISDVQKIV